mmetsp:Transcript_19682/g.75592  ORF Transcript_19682/g.75592 Transcript_19682/m.75592 type:complete len:207 (-) Transcript_19682:7-627(-)
MPHMTRSRARTTEALTAAEGAARGTGSDLMARARRSATLPPGSSPGGSAVRARSALPPLVAQGSCSAPTAFSKASPAPAPRRCRERLPTRGFAADTAKTTVTRTVVTALRRIASWRRRRPAGGTGSTRARQRQFAFSGHSASIEIPGRCCARWRSSNCMLLESEAAPRHRSRVCATRRPRLLAFAEVVKSARPRANKTRPTAPPRS